MPRSLSAKPRRICCVAGVAGVTVNSVRQISCPRNRSQTASMAWSW